MGGKDMILNDFLSGIKVDRSNPHGIITTLLDLQDRI